MKTAICDSRTPKEALVTLQNFCDSIVLLPPFKALQEPVSAHPDMLIFPCPMDGFFFTHREYMETAKKALAPTGFDILAIDEAASDKYPGDILLNAAVLRDAVMGRLPYLSSSIKEYAKKNNLKLIDVKQGYAKCSSCIVGNSIITADPSIAKTAKKYRIDHLKITSGNIFLPGYDQGFIGGASGCDKENVYFCGYIDNHPDVDIIKSFCRDHGRNVVSLSESELLDIGSIFFI